MYRLGPGILPKIEYSSDLRTGYAGGRLRGQEDEAMSKGMPGSKTGAGSFFEVLEDREIVILVEDEVEIFEEDEAEGDEFIQS